VLLDNMPGPVTNDVMPEIAGDIADPKTPVCCAFIFMLMRLECGACFR